MIAHTFEHAGLTVEIHHDEGAESPRDWCNVGTMVCWHRRADLGDETVRMDDYSSAEEVAQMLRDERGAFVLLPLYLYEHGGMTIRTTAFGDPWDSGQVGWTFVTRDELRDEFGPISEDTIARAKDCLVAEVETYDSWLTGEVYGYVVRDGEGDDMDSCWGFVGDSSYVEGEARSAAEACAEQVKREAAERAECAARDIITIG